jgi:hypothetical protein
MTRRHILFAACTLVLLGQSFAHGQRQTERFIPIGQSPGASGKATRIGTVEAVDKSTRSIELATPEGRFRISLPERAPIWLDRSRQKQSTLSGGFDDLKTGRRAEVKFDDAERAGRVAWIKIEIME